MHISLFIANNIPSLTSERPRRSGQGPSPMLSASQNMINPFQFPVVPVNQIFIWIYISSPDSRAYFGLYYSGICALCNRVNRLCEQLSSNRIVERIIPNSPNPVLPSIRATKTEAASIRPREIAAPAIDQNIPLASR